MLTKWGNYKNYNKFDNCKYGETLANDLYFNDALNNDIKTLKGLKNRSRAKNFCDLTKCEVLLISNKTTRATKIYKGNNEITQLYFQILHAEKFVRADFNYDNGVDFNYENFKFLSKNT